MNCLLLFFIVICLPAILATCYSWYLNRPRGSVVDNLLFVITGTVFYTLLFSGATFAYYTLFNPEYIFWIDLFSAKAFFWPALLNSIVFAGLVPTVLFVLLPGRCVEFIKGFFLSGGYLIPALFSVGLLTDATMADGHNVATIDLLTALNTCSELWYFNFGVLAIALIVNSSYKFH